jgi:hypothetical protein
MGNGPEKPHIARLTRQNIQQSQDDDRLTAPGTCSGDINASQHGELLKRMANATHNSPHRQTRSMLSTLIQRIALDLERGSNLLYVTVTPAIGALLNLPHPSNKYVQIGKSDL